MEENKGNEKVSNKQFLYYAFILVAVLILGTVTATYAYFQVETSSNTASTKIVGKTDCIDVTFTSLQNGSSNHLTGLDINYPITDDYANKHVHPVEVTVTNNCSKEKEQDPIDYTLALSTFSKDVSDAENSYISDDKVRVKVEKAENTESNGDKYNELKSTGYLDTVLKKITDSSNNQELLVNHLQTLKNSTAEGATNFKDFEYETYTTKNNYIVDTGKVATGASNKYKIYLWVDYYEGDKTAYTNNGANHDANTYDNKTEKHKFESILSLIVNSVDQSN